MLNRWAMAWHTPRKAFPYAIPASVAPSCSWPSAPIACGVQAVLEDDEDEARGCGAV